MRAHSLLIILLIACSCSLFKKREVPSNLLIDVVFYPSFHLPVELKISKKRKTGYLVCKVFSNDSLNKINWYDSVNLVKEDFTSFFESLDTVSLLNLPNDIENVGADGITIDVTIQENESRHKFSSWSRTRKEQPSQYKFLDAIFNLANDKLMHQGKYLEDIYRYFRYEPDTEKIRLPIRAKEIVLEEISPPINGKEKKLFLERFVDAARSTDFTRIRKFAFDSLIVFDKTISTKKFLERGFREILDDTLLRNIQDSSKTQCNPTGIDIHKILLSIRKKLKITRGYVKEFQLEVNRDEENAKVKRMFTFDFFDTKKGYKLYRVNSFRLLSF